MKKKILIVGAGFLQVPMIKKAKEMGLHVAVADYNPEAIGIQYADEYYNCSTIDKDGLLKVALEFNPDGIATMATDMPMRSIAYVCNRLGLNSISEDTAYKATNKVEMIKMFKKHNVSSPKFFECNNIEECLKSINYFKSFPLIFKPSDSSGSRGVVKVNSIDEVSKAFEYSIRDSKDGKVLIEEYMEGPEVSVECFAVNEKINILQVTDKITTGAPHFVEVGHCQPSSLDEENVLRIKKLAEDACKSLGIKNGPAHAEIILTNEGPKMVEIGARMGGDCITSDLVPLSTGIDMIKATIDYALGNEIDLQKKFNKFATIKFLVSPINNIKEIIVPQIDDDRVKRIDITTKNGIVNSCLHSSSDRVGYIICQGNDKEELITISNNIIQNIKFK